jgi:hypothetical protein
MFDQQRKNPYAIRIVVWLVSLAEVCAAVGGDRLCAAP